MSKKRKKEPRKLIQVSGGGKLPTSFDRRALEKPMWMVDNMVNEREFESAEELQDFLNGIYAAGGTPEWVAETPLERAQALMYDAWGSTGRSRVILARKALEISKDCADAYVLLAEETARSAAEARGLYEEGVKAGEQALGAEAFEKLVGQFWGMIGTRPYMRARLGLAQCLWALGERQGAIAHYTDMLRLNPGDNQGIRYILAICLLEEGKDKALGKLLRSYREDISAYWVYTRALYTFRRRGADARARAHLRKALEENPFVPNYLLGKKRLPRRLPDMVGFGDKSEAVSYVGDALEAWVKTLGALAWLAREVALLEPPAGQQPLRC